MCCLEPSDDLIEALHILSEGSKPAELLRPDGLTDLRELRWVMGDTVVELAGIGYYHAGPGKRGLLG